MTGSVALDVVIGLVFIYLLYSLLASIIQEIIASFLGLRARNLKHGISRMLEDEPKNKTGNIFHRITFDSRQRIKRNFSKKERGLLKDFYQQPVIKYLASGQYFSKPSYISESDFSKAILEILKKKSDGDSSNIDKIKEALSDENNLINEETREHIKSLLDDAQNDLVKFKANLEDWFNNTMERVAGWYKKTVQLTLIIIGLVLAISFNVNTIEISKILSNDKDARDSMVNLASAYVTENRELIEAYQKDKLTTPSDSAKIDFNTKLDSLLKIKETLESDIEDVSSVLGFRLVDSLPIIKDLKERLTDSSTDSLKKILPSKQVLYNKQYIVEFPSSYLADKTRSYYEIVETTKGKNKEAYYYAEFNHVSYIWDNLWGYLITALAISLGAPFWFDLLNKLIRMRNSIQKNPKNFSGKDVAPQGTVSVNQRVG